MSENDKIAEFMITGLRMNRGVSETDFKSRFGKGINDVFGSEFDKFIKLGLMEDTVLRWTGLTCQTRFSASLYKKFGNMG